MLTVLFLCTGNSARSVLAEAILNARGDGRFRGLSAGSHPAGRVNPEALRVLAAKGIDATAVRSKSWDEFADGPPIDVVVTVCDSAAGESCPLFPGDALKVHWGIPDPAGAADEPAAFARTFDVLDRRITRLVALPLAELDAAARRAALENIAAEEGVRS